MKKIMFLLLSIILLVSCADEKTIDGVTYRPYGLLNKDEYKNDSIQYEISWEACVSGVLFFEVIAPPIYTFGFNLWQPIGKKTKYTSKKGVIE